MRSGAPVAVLANNGEMGGGEVMLLHLASAMRDLGVPTVVVGPEGPAELVDRAVAEGFDVVAVPGEGRAAYARGLRRWARGHDGPLWCNGLLPGLATAGLRDRVLHLHRLPDTPVQRASLVAARRGARLVLAPSATMAASVSGSRVLENWTADLPYAAPGPVPTPARVGFLGRLTRDKGVHRLAEAVAALDRRRPGSVRLVLGGEARFGDADDERVVGAALGAVEPLVERLGWVEPTDFFAQVDLAVFPSVWPEPFGLVVAEAMAAGTPFVVSDAGALREVAGPDHPHVARADDGDALARVVAAALDRSPDRHRADAEAARARWQGLHSPAAGRDRVAAVLVELGWSAPSTDIV